jgi:hypothetical protein
MTRKNKMIDRTLIRISCIIGILLTFALIIGLDILWTWFRVEVISGFYPDSIQYVKKL